MCVLMHMDIDGVMLMWLWIMKKLLQIIRIEQYDRGRRLQCLRVNITLRKGQLPACRKCLHQQLGEICLTIREIPK